MEAAPRVVGRGRVVSFAPTPAEAQEASALDLWAVRATLGGRHGSRTGRLNNGASALALALPTDVPAGTLAELRGALNWRAAAAAALGDAAPAPAAPAAQGGTEEVRPLWALDTPTTFLARPSAFVAGDRIVLGARHYTEIVLPPFAPVTIWAARKSGSGALGAPLPPLAPSLQHLGGSLSLGRPLEAGSPLLGNMALLRGAIAQAPSQALLWTGGDALTGAGLTALASTEDMGWLTPVPAREATARATLAVRGAWAASLPSGALPGQAPGR